MSKALIIIDSSKDRETAISWVRQAPIGCRVEFKHTTRTLPQNAKMWAMLTEISRKVRWHGQKLTPEDWKDVFTASLRCTRVVPGIDEGTVVPLGLRTSKLTRDEFNDLIALIEHFAATRGVKLEYPT